MRNICIIPARGGSKRIPRKNIKPFCGKPLIAYSIETAIASGLFDRIVVSTEDEEIAEVARKYGAEVPFMRPMALADDHTGSGAPVRYTLERLQKEGESYDFCCTLYATAPMLRVEYLKKGLDALLQNSDAHMAFSVASMPYPIQRAFKITKEGRCAMFTPQFFSCRSQDLEEAYHDAGQFYWENLRNEPTDIPFGRSSIPIVIPRYLVQDIDTMEDWQRAERMYKINNPNAFDVWNDVKQRAHNTPRNVGFKPREIFWMRIGQNVGSEEFGKGNEFQRPVLIVKKLTRDLFVGIPLTSHIKQSNDYFHLITYKTKKGIRQSSAMILQLRTYDKKRLMGKIATLEKRQFEEVLKKAGNFFIPS